MPLHSDRSRHTDTTQHPTSSTDRPSTNTPSAPAGHPSILQTQPAPIIITPPPVINQSAAPQPSQEHSTHPPVLPSRRPHTERVEHIHPPPSPRQHSHDERRARFVDDIPSPPRFVRSPTPVHFSSPPPPHRQPVIPTESPHWQPSIITVMNGGPRRVRSPSPPPSPPRILAEGPQMPTRGPPYVYVSSPSSTSASSMTGSLPFVMPMPASSSPSYYTRFNPYHRKPPQTGVDRPFRWNAEQSAENTLPKSVNDMVDDLPSLLLFDLPLMYYGRFKQVFDRAERYIQTLTSASQELEYQKELMDSLVDAWQVCVESMIKDWETVNLVSPLLLGVIFTILQIDSAAYLPLVRFPLLVAGVCALVSLMCGCSSVMCFAALSSSEAVLEFIVDLSKRRSFLWNVWVLVSLPIIWLSWAMISMFVALAGFVWLTGTASDTPNPVGIAAKRALPPRIVISVLFVLGITSLCSSGFTGRHLRRTMQDKKKHAIEKLIKDQIRQQNRISADVPVKLPTRYESAVEQYIGRSAELDGRDEAVKPGMQPPRYQSRDDSNQQTLPRYQSIRRPQPTRRSSRQQYPTTPHSPPPPPPPPKVSVVKLIPLFAEKRPERQGTMPSDEDLQDSHLDRETWDELQKEVKGVWNTEALNPVFKVLTRWNERYFKQFGSQIVLAQETEPDNPEYGIYYVSTLDRLPHDPSRFTRLPPHQLAIFLPPYDYYV